MPPRPHTIFMDGFLASFAHKPTSQRNDPRNIRDGLVIHSENYYVDEPFILVADDGAWICALSIGDGQEASRSQRTTIRRSIDKGHSWSDPYDLEPADGPEGSKAVLLKTPSGRIYAFYIYNKDDLREVIGDNPPYSSGFCARVDSLGDFVFRFSDDHGVSWSSDRYSIPMRVFEIDRENPYQGSILFGMNSAIPCMHQGVAYIPFTKVGSFGEGLFSRSEGVLFKSDNILSEPDPDKIHWETLPDGEVGLRAPAGGGPIAEEHSFVFLSDGTMHSVYRTIDGWPAVAYSTNGGHSWTKPVYMQYANGRRIKCSRAADFAWKCRNGNYLYWYHNHGGGEFLKEGIAQNSHYSFEDRNPVWLCGGIEVDTPEGKRIAWSQPEIILYDDDPIVRISYPDLMEDAGEYYFTETNKDIGRIHKVDRGLIEGLWGQFDDHAERVTGATFEWKEGDESIQPAPWLPDFAVLDERFADYRTKHTRAGFTIDLWVRFDSLDEGQFIIDNRKENDRGMCLKTSRRNTVELVMQDDCTVNSWQSDPGRLTTGNLHHIAVVVDGGPNIISFIIDGVLCDGGDFRQFGWGRFSPRLETAKGSDTIRVASSLSGSVERLFLYDRYLTTSEVIQNWMAGI